MTGGSCEGGGAISESSRSKEDDGGGEDEEEEQTKAPALHDVESVSVADKLVRGGAVCLDGDGVAGGEDDCCWPFTSLDGHSSSESLSACGLAGGWKWVQTGEDGLGHEERAGDACLEEAPRGGERVLLVLLVDRLTICSAMSGPRLCAVEVAKSVGFIGAWFSFSASACISAHISSIEGLSDGSMGQRCLPVHRTMTAS